MLCNTGMGFLELIFGSDTQSECYAVVSDSGSRIETCGKEVWGQGYVDGGHKIEFCKEHVPSDATPWNSGRVESLKFYISDQDSVIEVS